MASLIVFPAIDLKGGQVVRLAEGDMDRATVYGDDPAAQAMLFADAGASHVHVVDLDAARTEHMIGHRIMNRAHAFWSFGFFSAGIISALIAQSGLSPQLHLFLMVPPVVVGTALLLGRFDPAPHRSGLWQRACRRPALLLPPQRSP